MFQAGEEKAGTKAYSLKEICLKCNKKEENNGR